MTDVAGVPANCSAQGRSPHRESGDLGSGPALPTAAATGAGCPHQSPPQNPLG